MNITIATSIQYGNYKHILPAAKSLTMMIQKYCFRIKGELKWSPDLKVVIRPIKGNISGRAITRDGICKSIEVDPRRMFNAREVLETVFHELVHCDQHETERMRFFKEDRRWMREYEGVVYNNDLYRSSSNYDNYYNSPWEVEARAVAKELIDKHWVDSDQEKYFGGSNRDLTRKVYPSY